MDSESDKSLVCHAHISLVREITEIGTNQRIVIENQKDMCNKLDDIRIALEFITLTAATNRIQTSSEIKQEKLRMKPIYWLFGVAGTGAVYEFWHWLHRTFMGK